MNAVFGDTDLTLQEARPAVADIARIVDGFKAFQVLRAGCGSGLFDWLEQNQPAERSVISAALNLRGEHLGGFLQSLEDLGLLVRQNGAYRLAPDTSEVLCQSSPWCQAHTLDSLLDPANAWSALQGFLTEGWRPTHPASPTSLVLHPMRGEAQRFAAYLASRIRSRPNHPAKPTLLCFDGGDGLLAAALCQHLPNAFVTVVVLPDALPRAQSTIASCGLTERCRLTTGTPLHPPPRQECKGFDDVVLFHSLYSVRKNLADALAAVATVLARSGELCCAHWFCLEACASATGGLRDLDKAILTDSHPLCGVETFCRRLEDTGLVDAQSDDLPGDYGTTKLHFARRPANT